MNIAICDDEPIFREKLITLLKQYSADTCQSNKFFEFSSGQLLINSENDFDIIFIDYLMGNLNGIETISSLQKNGLDSYIIFVSSYGEEVFNAMKVRPFRFLTKPVSIKEITETIDDIISDIQSKNHIIIKCQGTDIEYVIIEDQILYAQAENNYTVVFTKNHSFIYKHTLTKFSSELKGNCFFRCNRSYIVNMKYITQYSHTEIKLQSNERIPISKRKFIEFRKAFFNYIKYK